MASRLRNQAGCELVCGLAECTTWGRRNNTTFCNRNVPQQSFPCSNDMHDTTCKLNQPGLLEDHDHERRANLGCPFKGSAVVASRKQRCAVRTA
eukprot:354507-Chlamydomonas_euryale.AAC.8